MNSLNLQFLISCALGLVSADYNYTPQFKQYTPLLDNHGLPIDTIDVQAARANHLASHNALRSQHLLINSLAGKSSYNSNYAEDNNDQNLFNRQQHIYQHQGWNNQNSINSPSLVEGRVPYSYGTYQGLVYQHNLPYSKRYDYLQATAHNIQTPALLQHSQHEQPSANHGQRYWRNYRPATIGYNGQPIETPEVQIAKAHHLSIQSLEAIRNGLGKVGTVGNAFNYPVIQDTPAVQAAKAQHLAAHIEANNNLYHKAQHY